MKAEFKLFVVIGVFFAVVGVLYGVVTDWKEFVPAFIEEVKKIKAA